MKQELTHFAVGNVAEHSGHIVTMTGPAFPADGGWTEQDVTGAHGTILAESNGRTVGRGPCERALTEWLADCPGRHGGYCYTHNPGANGRR